MPNGKPGSPSVLWSTFLIRVFEPFQNHHRKLRWTFLRKKGGEALSWDGWLCDAFCGQTLRRRFRNNGMRTLRRRFRNRGMRTLRRRFRNRGIVKLQIIQKLAMLQFLVIDRWLLSWNRLNFWFLTVALRFCDPVGSPCQRPFHGLFLGILHGNFVF